MNYNCLKMTNLYLTYCCEMIFNFIVLFQLCHDNFIIMTELLFYNN